MHIDIIETSPSLAELEDNWNAVYDADDEAQIFLSWKWLSGWLSSIPGPWFILAAKERDCRRSALRRILSAAAADHDREIRRFRQRPDGWQFRRRLYRHRLQAGGGAQGHSGLCPRHQADELGAPPSRQCQDVRAALAAADGLLSEEQASTRPRSTRSSRSTGSTTASAPTPRCRTTGTAISTRSAPIRGRRSGVS